MQGYILNINKVREEDLIVTILSETKLKVMYRFYGARHSTIGLGYKIDFEAKTTNNAEFKQLKSVIHLANSWLIKRDKLYIWQQFIALTYKHLKDVSTLDTFYHRLLEETETRFEKQNEKRVCIESYITLLKHEGRLHDEFICFVCEEPIEEELSFARSFLSAHPERCVFGETFKTKTIKELFDTGSTLFLEDEEVEHLWDILIHGF